MRGKVNFSPVTRRRHLALGWAKDDMRKRERVSKKADVWGDGRQVAWLFNIAICLLNREMEIGAQKSFAWHGLCL